jgi:hypothetical protein
MTQIAIFQSLEYSVNTQTVDRSTTPNHKQIQDKHQQCITNRQSHRKRPQRIKKVKVPRNRPEGPEGGGGG